ncbi:MAG: spermidine synthase [Hydrogenophilales bacterium 16-64-46]|nr:MAG: spermidine synthase [Hydrogenophilales bacterium 12-64-13]OYZ05956.1 MAG: spermidine synthase [Hydrogenophilales bacterium 16-64-46]OZA39892.1 MAG: spermidine synthase [Hydrogenophilales bacterium 17-64-34]HQT00316.1 polyamine aminopropyltransferase [Thiobacillus sp.]
MRLKFGKHRASDDGVEVTEARGVRTLHLGSRAIQSAMRVSRPWDLELAYTRAMMGFVMFNPQPQQVLMIGLGGGSLAKFIRKHREQTHITAVEIDPRVIAAARGQFELPPNDATLDVIEADGALYVRQHPASADVILLDGFDAGNQVEALATQTFYDACRRALRPGGILVVNLWGRDHEFAEYFARLARAFDGEIGWLSVQDKTNVIVFGFADDGASAKLVEVQPRLADLGKRWGLDLRGFARDMQWADGIAPLLG